MIETNTNPLTGIRFRIPFDEIQAEHVEPAVETLLAEARQALDRLAGQREEQTFDNTMCALDQLTEKLDYAMGIVRHVESVATSLQWRKAYNAVQPAISAFYTSIPLNAELWRTLKSYASTSEARALTGIRRRFLDKTIDEFRRHGADLDAAGKKRLEEIDIELAQLTTNFAEHTLDATNAFDYMIEDEAGLAGLPPSAREMAHESARGKDRTGWRFTLQGPSYVSVMTYLDDAAVREKFHQAYNTRAAAGEFDNTGNLTRILELRRAKAELLGYRDFADFVLADRMAKTGAHAQAFLDELTVKTEAHFQRENEELQAFRHEIEGAGAPAIEPWDVAYYAEKLRQARFDFNEEDLRPYFPLRSVVAGMFELVGRLYGIRVEEETGVPAWDPKTQYYKVLDDDGKHLGSFYADWYPRDNKRGGAWMDSLITGLPRNGEYEPHLGLMCGNLNPPAGGKPALLTHRDVETIFHEFGHLLHHLLTRVPVRSLAGTSVAWDFVELPSQIMENWCWEREALDLFARHYETGAADPRGAVRTR